MKYRLVAVGRLQDGTIQLLGAGDVEYHVTADTAWEDLNSILDDEDLPEPEPIQKISMGVDENHEAVKMVEGVAAEMYGPMAGKLARNGVVAVLNLIKSRMA